MVLKVELNVLTWFTIIFFATVKLNEAQEQDSYRVSEEDENDCSVQDDVHMGSERRSTSINTTDLRKTTGYKRVSGRTLCCFNKAT